MIKLFFNLKIFLFFLLFTTISHSEIINKIEVYGNKRISQETVKMFSNIVIGDNLEVNEINSILKDLYNTNYFEDVSVSLEKNVLKINVKEYPIIQNINYDGIKSIKLLNAIILKSLIREKSPYNELILKLEKERIYKTIKSLGYYNSSIDSSLIVIDENLVAINFYINLGDKSKIKKITFTGNKIFKDSKLKRLIASSEYKFWKVISGKKYLNENNVELDKRLLKNYYLNNGYYNVEINSSFARSINKNEFELIFNINANNKIYFNDLKISLPSDFDEENFKEIDLLFQSIKNKPYSINLINKILDEIDNITELEQYMFIDAIVKESLIGDKIDLTFQIQETEKKFYAEKINIFGNFITEETVIRNQLELDEGDPLNDILINKSINNLKSMNFFKSVRREIIVGKNENTKILNIYVEEKPTGEIFAAAGIGTEGASVGFGIKENNFLGRGVSLDSNFTISSDSFKGKFGFTNPNFKNSDKSLYANVEAIETDNYNTFGYKSNKTGFNLGTNFEYLKDFRLGIGTSNFYEVISTNDTASSAQQSQEGNYWDSFINFDFIYDKRNQKFQTTSGFISAYSLDLPIISEKNTLINNYQYSHYFDLFEKNVSSISLLLKSAKSINNKDIKLSERVKIPSNRLRGFESGRLGPKDGDDFIGGNYGYALNFSSTIPQLLDQSQNVDFLFFIDAANLWGVDYDNSLDDSGKIRSSTGIGLDWFSPLGPMNFSLAYPITKEDGDKTETFRFNLGTTF